MKPLTLSLLLCIAHLSWSTPSVAQPTTSTESARSDYRKAEAEIAKGNYRGARTLLLDLFKRSPTFDVAAALAATESRLGEHARAAHYYAQALASVPPKEKADTAARIRSALDAELPRVATVRISVNRDTAEIVMDGEVAGTFPQLAELYADPGKHTIEARVGGGTAKQEIQATAGASIPLSFELAADAAAASSPAVAPTSQAATIEALPPPQQPAEAEPRPNWLPAGVSAGLALVAIGVGTGFVIDASSAKSDGEKKRQDAEQAFGTNDACSHLPGAGSPICADLEDLQDRRKRSNTAAKVSLGLGAVFAAAAVGSYFLWARPASDGRTARIGAWVTDRGGSVSFEGSF